MSAPAPTEWRDSVLLDVALLDPRTLKPHPRNVRADLGDLSGLTASIAAQGVIESLTVIQLEDGSHQIVDGHRRTAAAVAAGVERVPCMIRRDLSLDAATDRVQAEHIGTMLAANLQREGLTAVEEAHGVQTMLDLGIDVATISARTGLARDRVLKAAGVARLAPAAAAAVADAGLTLDQAAVVARFEDNHAVVGDLVAAAGEGPGRFAHAVTRAEKDRAAAEQLASRRAELEAEGRRVLVAGEAPEGSYQRISGLLHHSEVLTPESHADCPGAAVLLSSDQIWHSLEQEEVCTDPAGNGHTNRWVSSPTRSPGSSMSDEELERQRAERREVVANNKSMDAANTTRRAWIREFLARRSAPKEVLRFAVEAIAQHPDAIYTWLTDWGSQEAKDAATELGLVRPARFRRVEMSLTSGEHVTDARLPLQLLAHIAGAIEGATPRDAWRSAGDDRRRLARWLTFLAGQGYELADIEQSVVDAATGTAS